LFGYLEMIRETVQPKIALFYLFIP
jgi:hypothetical protein